MTQHNDLQALCELGQRQLMETEYLAAERSLVEAERLALGARDWDTLSRLYMPLQETRRQIRQRCGEGVVCLDLVAQGAGDRIDARRVIENYPHGQLLVAGWGSVGPAGEVRRMAREMGLYVEAFLGAVYPVSGGGRAVVIAPTEEAKLPAVEARSIEELRGAVGVGAVVLGEGEIPAGARRGTSGTYAEVMGLWEALHRPFLASADGEGDLVRKIEKYRETIRVDSACELAHQRLSATAGALARGRRG